MELIITGASGFVGRNLVEYLTEKNVCSLPFNRAILASDVINIPDQTLGIVHLAGKAHDLKKTSNADEYYQVNFELTKKLYDAFLHSGAKKFIFVSSVKAAADVVEHILDEHIRPNPQTHYGKSKLMAEEYIQNQPLPIGKSFYILRPCMIHGPGNKGNLNLLYKFVEKGIPYPLAAFENKRSFLSIENLCFIVNQLLQQNEIPSGIYNVSDDKSLSTSEVVKILADSMNKSPRLWNIPKGLVKSLAKVGDILKLPLNTERLSKLTESYVVSNQKIKKALSADLPVQSRAGLIETAKSFKTT